MFAAVVALASLEHVGFASRRPLRRPAAVDAYPGSPARRLRRACSVVDQPPLRAASPSPS